MNGAVITAKNEADTIGRLVIDLHRRGLNVCVVDDGSTDETGAIASEYGAFVIRHEQSAGIGKSLVDAWRYAISQNWKRTAQLDAGGSHNPYQVDRLFTSGADITIGSRFMTSSEYVGRSWRSFASRVVAELLNWTTHQKISDWTSGYRVFSLNALKQLVDVHYMTNMHTWQIEVLDAAIHKGLTIAEFPITYRAGNSSLKWSTLDDLVKVYLWILNR